MNIIKSLIRDIKYILNKNTEDNIPAIAARSAFFIILSFVPFLMFALAILTNFGVTKSMFNGVFSGAFIDDSMNSFIKGLFDEVYSRATGIAITTIIIALWSAGKGVYSITEGIRVVYKLPNKYNWLIKRIFSMGYTLLMFVAIVVGMLLLVASEFTKDTIRYLIKDKPAVFSVLFTLRYVVAFVIVTLLIAFALKMYLRRRVEDKRYCSFLGQLPGALITSASWVVLTLGIKIYVNYFNGFSIYGSLGTITIIMVWVYFSIYAFAFGIQINYILCLKKDELYILKLFKRKS